MAPPMPPGPPKVLESLAKALIPPACREEVLGDLYERYKSPVQYLGDLLSTLPFVTLSRIMRNTPIQLLLMDALLVYGSFLAASWYLARKQVADGGGLMRLAIPSGLTLLFLLIGDAFTGPRRRTAWNWIRPLVISLALIALCDAAGLYSKANFYGFILSTMLVSFAKLMFEPGTRQPQAAGGPALLAGRESRPVSRTARVTMTLIFLGLICLVWWEIVTRTGVKP
jgi:hypothetical protein